ncbi:MAG: hypothetical protein JNL83_22505 [Myxococcales bacterium]|nr:hypothetical protein [Myxococcales bacterium]
MGLIVALLLALTVPVGQLRTATIERTCCCPDPASCHCPDGGDAKSDQPHLKACHQDTQVHVAPVLPAFAAPISAASPVVPVRTATLLHVLSSPHDPPAPPRPAGPS